MTTAFRPARNRDAYAAIRGYVYQIDRTVDRWLDLTPDEWLELERGEDIDVAGRAADAGLDPAAEARLLEQVKHREANLTLRSPAVSEALANFLDHHASNPRVHLRFCFVTNATVGHEQLRPFPGGLPGVELWEQIRGGRYSPEQLPAALDQLRQFLNTLQRPDGLALSVWDGWKTFLAANPAGGFERLVRGFEFSTGRPDAGRMASVVRDKLVSLGVCLATDAPSLHDRLFVYVARLLTAAGLKRLTAADRTRVLAEPAFPTADRAMLDRLRGIVGEHAVRLDDMEVRQHDFEEQLTGLLMPGTPTTRFVRGLIDVELTLPIPVARLSRRTAAVRRLCALLDSRTWVAVHGGPDAGKSQLGLLVAEAHGGCRGWVRFHHDQRPAEAADLADAALARLAGWHQRPARAGWQPEAAAAVGADALVVLDDLPRLADDVAATERFAQLGIACRQSGVRVLSTSQFMLPGRVRAALGDGLSDDPVPPFTDDEAGELFHAFGAPDTLTGSQGVPFMNGLAGGHPLLLAATAEFLRDRGWAYREEEFAALLRGDHTQRVMPEVVGRLTHTLDDTQRELLYRLTLPLGTFSDAEAMALAAVSPAVSRPRERFSRLLGSWVQQDSATRLAVSPLVRPLGRTELADDVRVGCYRELAGQLIRGGTLDQSSGESAVLYSLEARQYDQAAILYVSGLSSVLREPRHPSITRFIDKWRDTPLPGGLSVGAKLMVRAYQWAAFTRHDLDSRYVLADADALLEAATGADGWGVIALAVNGVSHGRQDARRVLRYIRRALALPQVYGRDGGELVFDTVFLPDTLWMLVTDLDTPAALSDWLDAAEAVPAAARQRFWASDRARQAVLLVPNRLYLTECDRPAAEAGLDGGVAGHGRGP